MKNATTIPTDLIAPCGMNCRLCWGFIREKNSCPGCNRIGNLATRKSRSRSTCIIRNCELISSGKIQLCSPDCQKFPCARLKQLDKRYRAKYGMSMIDNLNIIHDLGIRHFIRSEKEKWTCPGCGELLCVHRLQCLNCGHKWQEN